ncbi:MAG: TolC family protein [Acidobacteriia bacterium]|nr:TolC family protein [Terriglobia bacterium]
MRRERIASCLLTLLVGTSACAQVAETTPQQNPPLTITLQDALQRARGIMPQLLAANTEAEIAHQERVQARAAMLPTISYTTSYLYTQGNGTPSGLFIANNAVHEYLAQGNAHEALNLGWGQIAEYRRSGAAEALARAKAEVATRGLAVTVVENYYGYVVAQRKYASAQEAKAEAEHFFKISQELESGGEVAHSDAIKAQLQLNDRRRDFQEARLAMDKARLALAVLLFPHFTQDFSVVDDLHFAPPLASFAEVTQAAQKNNPELRAAGASLEVAQREVQVAWATHFPSLTFDYWYGIDAAHFATYTGGVRNLGYAAEATLSIPIWDWGALRSKVKQASLRRRQAQVELTFAQRQLQSNMRALYADASTARTELDTLRSSAELAADSLRLTDLRYQAGEATALEVVDAQNTLVQARNAYDDGEARYRVALANLQTLTGTF